MRCMEGRSVRSTERSEARNAPTRSEAKGHAIIQKILSANPDFDNNTERSRYVLDLDRIIYINIV